jgi:hypothetical protein
MVRRGGNGGEERGLERAPVGAGLEVDKRSRAGLCTMQVRDRNGGCDVCGSLWLERGRRGEEKR